MFEHIKLLGVSENEKLERRSLFSRMAEKQEKPTNPNAVMQNTFVNETKFSKWSCAVFHFSLLQHQCTVDCGMWKGVECEESAVLRGKCPV